MPVKGQPQGIPAPVGVKDQQVAQILSALREHILALHGTVAPIEQAYRGGGFGGGGGSGFPDVPGGGGIDPTVRPNPPVNLQATGIFGAVILTVDALPGNAAYIEWLSATEDVPGNATVIGQSRVPLFNYYVGDNTLRYYWARAVGYGNTPLRSALNSTQGTPGQSAPDPDVVRTALTSKTWQPNTSYLAFEVVRPTQDIVIDGVPVSFQAVTGGVSGATEPNWPTAALGDQIVDGTVTWEAIDAGQTPFIVGEVNGHPTVFILSAAIKDASIESAKIKNLAANKIVAENLSVISANMGEVTSGTFRTGTNPNLRAEMSSAGAFPLWIGSGAKSANNAIFYVDQNGAAAFTGAVAFSNLTGVPDLGGGDGSLVHKSSFEDGSLGGWSDLAGDSGLSVGNVTGQPFTKALYSSTRDIYEENNVFPVSPGEQFYVSFWSYTVSTTYDSGLGLQFTDKSGNHTWIKINAAPGNNWQEHHGVITAPADAVTARPWYTNDFTGTPGDTSQFTNVFIYRDTSSATEKIAAWARENHTTLIDGRSIYTGDAYVDTLQIKGDAVTVPMGVSTTATQSFNLPVSGWQTIQTLSIPAGTVASPTPFQISAGCYSQLAVSSGNTTGNEYTQNGGIYLRVVVDGTALAEGRASNITIYLPPAGQSGAAVRSSIANDTNALSFQRSLNQSYHSIQLQISFDAGQFDTKSAYVSGRYIYIIGVQR